DLISVRKALQRRKALVAHTIYECGGCGERFLGERRCGDCNLFARAVGVGGVCPECDPVFSLMTCSERGWFPPRESTASRESAWTCRSARAELGKPLRGFPHGPLRAATTASSFHVFNLATHTARPRVFIMTTIQTQRPTPPYVY